MVMESVYYNGKEFQVENGMLEIYEHDDLDILEIKGLENLNELGVLKLDNNSISQFKGLENLSNLSHLSLSGNNIPPHILEKCGSPYEELDAQSCVEYCRRQNK